MGGDRSCSGCREETDIAERVNRMHARRQTVLKEETRGAERGNRRHGEETVQREVKELAERGTREEAYISEKGDRVRRQWD